jgi:hypothetical protein
MVDAIDDLNAVFRRLGKPLVALTAALCVLALGAGALNAVAYFSRNRACSSTGDNPGVVLVAGGSYYQTVSSCMSDEQLQAVQFFVVSPTATNGVTYSLRPASTLRVPVATSPCGSALLVRSLDPDYDALLVGTTADLLTKVQSSQMVAYVMRAASSSSPPLTNPNSAGPPIGG